MVTLVVLFVVLGLGFGWWCAVQSTPWVLSLFLPARLTIVIGSFYLLAAALIGCYAVYELRDPELFLACLVQGFVGSWLMMAPFSALRGSQEYDDLLKVVGIMLAAAVVVLMLSLYLRTNIGQATLELWLVLFGGGLVMRIPRLHPRN
jgi:hypothetical protein